MVHRFTGFGRLDRYRIGSREIVRATILLGAPS